LRERERDDSLAGVRKLLTRFEQGSQLALAYRVVAEVGAYLNKFSGTIWEHGEKVHLIA